MFPSFSILCISLRQIPFLTIFQATVHSACGMDEEMLGIGVLLLKVWQEPAVFEV